VPDSPTLTLNNGAQIPQLGLGVYLVTGDDVEPAVRTALEVGYRHIDTAAAYGNEEGVGRAIAQSGIARDELFVTTKLPNEDQGYDNATAAFENSLDRLGLDYVDLYLIHWPAPAKDLYVESWQALEKFYTDGRARSIGVSNFLPNHLHRLQSECTVLPAVNQIELHPTFGQTALVDVHRDLGIATESWSPLGVGADLDSPTITGIATRLGRTPAQVVIRWHLQLGYVVIPKSARPERIASNFDVFDFELDDSDLTAISALDADNRIGGHPDDVN
jgi:diketogulonate reductase-like aldo/keto reductase